MKPKSNLSSEAAALLRPRLQTALNNLGECIDILHKVAPTMPRASHAEWVLAVDALQEALVGLTIAAGRVNRKS
jgi:hypothetical protein